MNSLFGNLPGELKQYIETINSAIEIHFPGMRGNRISDCLDRWLLDDEQREILGLNPWNMVFLGVSGLFVEMGMAQFGGKRFHATPDPEIGGAMGHPADRIKNHCKTFGIRDEKAAEIIATILSGVIASDVDSDGFFYSRVSVYEGAPIHIGLLAGALRLAAGLALDHPNTFFQIAEHNNGGDRMTIERISESFNVLFTGPHAFLPGTILIKIHCRDAEVHRALKHYESRMQRLLYQMNGQISPRFLFSDVIFEIEPDGYHPMDLKFSVDSTAALQLFTGNRLYMDKRVFLRELIQNALDACNLKRLFDEDYAPGISIEMDSRLRFIRFRDNGIGMDRQWIEKYFLKIGISFYQSGDIKAVSRKHVDVSFISKFGIGFLSSFIVSDRIVIRTRKKGSPGLLITITNLQDYFDVRSAGEDCPLGTEVTLNFRGAEHHYARAMAYLCYLKTNIRYLSIPVELLDHEGNIVTIGHEKPAYDIENTSDTCAFVSRLGFPDAEAFLFLRAKRVENTLYALDSAKGGVSVFQDGIFVTQTDSLLPEGARQNVIGRINLKGKDRCELSMDRNRIFWTEKQYRDIKRVICLGMVDLTNQLLEGTQAMTPPLTVEKSLINHLAIFFDFNDVDDEIYCRLCSSLRNIMAKRFRDFIRVNFPHTGKRRSIPEADGYNHLWQREILASFAERGIPRLPVK